MSDTFTSSKFRVGQVVERDGQRFIVDKVQADGVIKLCTESGAFAMFSHVNSGWTAVPQAAALELDEAAWRAGFMSGNLRRDETCPYPTTSVEAWAWSSGRIEGAAKPRGTLPQLRPIKNSSPPSSAPWRR